MTATTADTTIIAGLVSGFASDAKKPIAPNAPKPRLPSTYRRAARSPSPRPTMTPTATMNSSNASLSLVPNSSTTKSLAPGGWRSIAT